MEVLLNKGNMYRLTETGENVNVFFGNVLVYYEFEHPNKYSVEWFFFLASIKISFLEQEIPFVEK